MIKKVLFLIFPIIVSFSNASFALDNEIESVQIIANIIDDKIKITETWKGNFYFGTELYHSYNNLKLENITDFAVLENGIKYKNIDNWKIEFLKENKKNKSSVIQTEDGVELCFGLDKNGYHEYKIQYIIKDIFVNNELSLNFWDNNNYKINNFNIIIKGSFDDNVFTKLENAKRNIYY